MRSPAEGLSANAAGLVRDEIIIFEVMAEEVDKPWWKRYRAQLEKQFDQDQIVVRASKIRLL